MSTQEMRRNNLCSVIHAPALYQSQVGIFILRVGVALLVLCHGWPKFIMLVDGKGSEWLDPLGFGGTTSLALCVVAEFFCALCILLGFLTRVASFVLIVNFWVAIFVYGNGGGLSQNELPLLYMLCFVALLCTGSGPMGVDRSLSRRLFCGR